MTEPGYVVRQWTVTGAGHARVTVVDLHGRVVHVTVRDTHQLNADVHGMILARLAQLPAPKVQSR